MGAPVVGDRRVGEKQAAIAANSVPEARYAITGSAEETLSRLLGGAARDGLLRVPVREAAMQIPAANVGVTLSLIGQSEGFLP